MTEGATIETGSIILTNSVRNGSYTFHHISQMYFDDITFKNPMIIGDTSKLVIRFIEFDEERKHPETIIESPFDIFKKTYFDIPQESISWMGREKLHIVLGIRDRQGKFIGLSDNARLNFEGLPQDKRRMNFADVPDFSIKVGYETSKLTEVFHPMN